MNWNALFVLSKCTTVASVVAKTGTTISYGTGGVSPIKNGGCINLMARLNCTLVYAGDSFIVATRGQETRQCHMEQLNRFRFATVHWTSWLH